MTTKKPQDRKPPKPTVKKVEGGRQVTIQGVKVTVLDEALDDFELLEDLNAMQDGNGARIASVFRALVGDQRKMVLDSLRGENGRVKASDATAFVKDLFGALRPES